MKKTTKIIIVCILSITSLISSLLFTVVAPVASLAVVDSGVYYDYRGWKLVEIPTDSVLKAKVRLPEDWYFFSDGERLYIKDSEGSIIATEVYEDWRITRTVTNSDGTKEQVNNKHEINVNTNLPTPLQDLDAYELYKGGSNGCDVYKVETDDRVFYAIKMTILNDGPKRYVLNLVFNDDTITDKDFRKILTSYRFGGYVEGD